MKVVNMTHTLHQPRSNPLAIVLLCVGILVFSISMVFLLNSNAKLSALKNQKEQHLIAIKAISRPELNDHQLAELNAVKIVIEDIVRPWPRIFRAIESANLEAVNVLSIEPNVKKETFRITAIAFSIDSMLAYVKRLNQQDVLKFVNLMSTEAVEVDGQNATQFELLLKWTG